MAGDYEQGRVATAVEVACFNFIAGSFFLIGLKQGRDRMFELPSGWLQPGEEPDQGAVRMLKEVTRISTGVHLPVFVRAYPSTMKGVDCLVLTYTVLATTPTELDIDWQGKVETRGAPSRLYARVSSGEAAVASRLKIREVVSQLPVATRIAPQLSKSSDGLFRLKELHLIYERILGQSIDVANLRRKVEAIPGFVEKVKYDEVMQSAKPPAVVRGRRALWYRAGNAKVLDPPVRFEAT